MRYLWKWLCGSITFSKFQNWTTVGQFFDSTRRKFWKILEITLGQLLDKIKTTLGQHCDYLVIIVGTYLCPATNDHFFPILHTISTVSMPISWGVFPDRVAKPLVRSVSMKPGEQLVLVMWGNLDNTSWLKLLNTKLLLLFANYEFVTFCQVQLYSSWQQPC